MSYIRCLSNPESLYVWEETDRIAFTISKEYGTEFFYIPTNVFHQAALAFNKTWDQPVEFEGCQIDEVFVYPDDWSLAERYGTERGKNSSIL